MNKGEKLSPPGIHIHAEEAGSNDPILDQDPQKIVHPNVGRVHGPEEVTYGIEELVVLCLVRNGRTYVRSFIEHYASMGVNRIVFLDTGSTDGTVEALKGYGNVTVLRSMLSYKRYNIAM